MKKKCAVLMMAAVGLVLVSAPASAQYASIQHNLFNGVGDTTFDPGTGEFRIHATTSNLLTLNDPTPLSGVIANTVIDLSTTFNQVLGTGQAQFTGGFLSLTFDFDGSPYEISGPITGVLFEISQVGPNSKIDGLGRWTATTKNLPGSGIWPDGGGFSSLDSLTLAFGQDLSNFDWENQALNGRVESLYSLFPNDSAIPEPATLSMLALGAIAMLRRRRS